MGIIDRVTSLLPGRERSRGPSRNDALALRDGIHRWLETILDEPGRARSLADTRWLPATDVHETDREVVVRMEVPGMKRDDIELSVMPHALVVRGEKREEKEDRRKDYRLVEMRYGTFVRTVPLPAGLDLDHAEAVVKNGVLTVRFPKTTASDGRRIPIQS